MKTLNTNIHYYYFNTEKANERAAYEKLCAELKATEGRGRWLNALADTKGSKDRVKARGTSKQITLETKCLFDNQWNTDTDRVFDWYEGIVPNKRIKSGHYLDITPDMIAVRENVRKCGYCGAHHHDSDKVFCDKCLGSEYLERENLPLLRLQSVSDNSKRAELSESELEELLTVYKIEQKNSATARLKQKQQRERDSLAQKARNIEIETEALEWLIEHDLFTDNVIYYSHKEVFCFGWRKPLSEDYKSRLLDACGDFGFPFFYEIEEG